MEVPYYIGLTPPIASITQCNLQLPPILNESFYLERCSYGGKGKAAPGAGLEGEPRVPASSTKLLF